MRTTGILAVAGFAAGAAFLVGTVSAVPPDPPTATAKIESKSGSKVTGKATFTEVSPGVTRVEVWIENATPGSHGLHLHEKGDCSAPDATSGGLGVEGLALLDCSCPFC